MPDYPRAPAHLRLPDFQQPAGIHTLDEQERKWFNQYADLWVLRRPLKTSDSEYRELTNKMGEITQSLYATTRKKAFDTEDDEAVKDFLTKIVDGERLSSAAQARDAPYRAMQQALADELARRAKARPPPELADQAHSFVRGLFSSGGGHSEEHSLGVGREEPAGVGTYRRNRLYWGERY